MDILFVKRSANLNPLYAVWTALLVSGCLAAGAADLSGSLGLSLLYWSVNGLTAAGLTAVAVLAWWRARQVNFAVILVCGTVALTASQLLLRASPIWSGTHPVVIVAHLLAGTLTLGIALVMVTTARCLPVDVGVVGLDLGTHRFFLNTIIITAAGLLLLLVTGAIVTNTGSGLACPDWPLCQGQLWPAEWSPALALNLLHRLITLGLGVLVAAVVLQAQRYYSKIPVLIGWARALGLIFLLQILAGGLYAVLGSTPAVTFLHLGLAALVWGCLVVLFTLGSAAMGTALPIPRPASPKVALTLRQQTAVYFKLTKPWIMILLLLTTAAAMFMAARSVPSLSLIFWTLLGGALSAGGASVLNSYLDSDIDQVMSRTSHRATVTGQVTPQATLIYGLMLSLLSFGVLALLVNLTSAVWSTIGILYYVFFYTLYLKRSTLHNIIIGGAAGAIPPLVGWTAVTHGLDLGALYLFAIIFFWTPPHTWALALMVKKDYAQAKVPMLPVIIGDKETTYHILLYSILLVVLTLLPFTFGMFSGAYLIVALLLGFRFLHLAWSLWQDTDKATSRKLYKYSQRYLALLFLAMALDRLLF
jgi:protoheme IX farnesyltransferase